MNINIFYVAFILLLLMGVIYLVNNIRYINKEENQFSSSKCYKEMIFLTLLCLGIVTCIVMFFVNLSSCYKIKGKTYSAKHFNINVVQSEVDFNGDGIDDYLDIMLGARKDAINKPNYDEKEWDGGYPPDNIGVCTDVIWRAFKNAGYCLKDMVNNDIKLRPKAYTTISHPDENIDFRRVRNLHVFFEKYAQSLTLDIDDISEWQPGDIIIFNYDRHIGIVSDRRNKYGKTLIIHNGGQENREEDILGFLDSHGNKRKITGHYRFNAAKIPINKLVKWRKEKREK